MGASPWGDTFQWMGLIISRWMGIAEETSLGNVCRSGTESILGLALKSTFLAVYSKVMMGCYYKYLQCEGDPSAGEGLSVAGVCDSDGAWCDPCSQSGVSSLIYNPYSAMEPTLQCQRPHLPFSDALLALHW